MRRMYYGFIRIWSWNSHWVNSHFVNSILSIRLMIELNLEGGREGRGLTSREPTLLSDIRQDTAVAFSVSSHQDNRPTRDHPSPLHPKDSFLTRLNRLFPLLSILPHVGDMGATWEWHFI